MMFYHDGLRTITAETARHSSKTRAPLSDLLTSTFYSISANVHLSDVVLCKILGWRSGLNHYPFGFRPSTY